MRTAPLHLIGVLALSCETTEPALAPQEAGAV
jgi:hypothetical protein